MEKEMRRLPDSELEVMQALWALEEPICRAAVEEKLADKKSMAVTYQAAQSRRFVQQICGGSISAFASALCDSGLSREDLDELRRLLEEDAL